MLSLIFESQNSDDVYLSPCYHVYLSYALKIQSLKSKVRFSISLGSFVETVIFSCYRKNVSFFDPITNLKEIDNAIKERFIRTRNMHNDTSVETLTTFTLFRRVILIRQMCLYLQFFKKILILSIIKSNVSNSLS